MKKIMKREFYAKKLADHFGIDLNETSMDISNILGPYISKMKKAFSSNSSKVEFKFESDNRISSNLYSFKYKRGEGNTYSYVQTSFQFFGLLENHEYDEVKMTKYGWEIPELAEYKTFDEYLLKTSNKIDPSANRNDIKILTSIFMFLYGAKTNFKAINRNQRVLDNMVSNNIFSDYKGIFDSIYMLVFKEKTPFHGKKIVPKKVKSKTNLTKYDDLEHDTSWDDPLNFNNIEDSIPSLLKSEDVEITKKVDTDKIVITITIKR